MTRLVILTWRLSFLCRLGLATCHPLCQPGQVQHVLARLSPLGIEPDGKKVSFTFSSGWIDYQPGERPEELLKCADVCALRRQASQK